MGLLDEIREQPDVIARTTSVNAEPAQQVAGSSRDAMPDAARGVG